MVFSLQNCMCSQRRRGNVNEAVKDEGRGEELMEHRAVVNDATTSQNPLFLGLAAL